MGMPKGRIVMSERNWDADWAMCEAATPGPFHIERYYDFPDGLHSAIIVLDNPLPDRPDDKYLMIVIGRDREEVDRDAHFYAETRSALPHWLQRAKELEVRLEEAESELQKVTRGCETCGGSGVMNAVVGDGLPYGEEILETTECGECHGTGVGWIGQIMDERDRLRARLDDLARAARALVDRIRGLEGDAPDSAPSADAMRDAREEVERLRSVYTAARVLLRYEEDGATENWLYWDKRLDDLRAAVDAYEKESALAGHMP